MKRLKVRFRPSADADVDNLEIWLAQNGAELGTIERYIGRLLDRCRAIGEAPSIGRRRDDLLPGLRIVVFEKRVVIAFTVEADDVEIINLFSHGRDYEAFYAGDDQKG